jgi:hypothetical protein
MLLHKQSVLEVFSWGGTDYTTTQAGTRILQNGCTADQVNLTVTPKPTKVSTPVTICSGETYTWDVTTYTAGNIFSNK